MKIYKNKKEEKQIAIDSLENLGYDRRSKSRDPLFY